MHTISNVTLWFFRADNLEKANSVQQPVQNVTSSTSPLGSNSSSKCSSPKVVILSNMKCNTNVLKKKQQTSKKELSKKGEVLFFLVL